MISTRDLSALPNIDALRRLMQSLAMLDAILCPEWGHRYFSFNCYWSSGEQLGSMRNGQGDHWFALFNAAGCWLKGFDHESPMSPFSSDPPMLAAGLFDDMSAKFSACLLEPAFAIEETTFCLWRRSQDSTWRRGPVKFPANTSDLDGSERLLQCLDGRPQTYRAWTKEYHERDVPLAAIQSVYAHQPLDQQLIDDLGAAISPACLKKDVSEIGYPSCGNITDAG